MARSLQDDLSDYDLHVNVIGGGKIDGPQPALRLRWSSSASSAAPCQDIAVTGEVSIQGKVKGVGGLPEKIYGAKQAGIKQVLSLGE